MEARLAELTNEWKNASRVGELLDVLVYWRKEKPACADVVHRLLRIIYVQWIETVKLDEFTIYENILTLPEKDKCRRLAAWSIADDETDGDDLPAGNWTMKGVSRLSRGYIDDSHIREMMTYPMYDWEILCDKLGACFEAKRVEIERQCFSSITELISAPHILDALSISA